ncbi:sulfotransferase [Methylolobus aquaticus]
MRPYLIVGTFRTGSSAFAEQLGLHPGVTCGWESTEHVFGVARVKLAEDFLRGRFDGLRPNERAFLRDRHGPEIEVIGFRLLFRSTPKWFFHPRFSPVHVVEGFNPHLRWLQSRRDISIIHLVRSDNLEWLKSIACARATQRYFGQEYPQDLAVTWNVPEALKRVRMKHYLGQRFGELSSSHAYIRVGYEEFRSDNRAVVGRVCDFLGVNSAMPLQAVPRAVIQSNTSHRITNTEELRLALEKYGLAFE